MKTNKTLHLQANEIAQTSPRPESRIFVPLKVQSSWMLCWEKDILIISGHLKSWCLTAMKFFLTSSSQQKTSLKKNPFKWLMVQMSRQIDL